MVGLPQNEEKEKAKRDNDMEGCDHTIVFDCV